MKFINRFYQILNSPFVWLFVFVAAFVLLIRTSWQLKQESNRLLNNQEVFLKDLERINLANGTIAQEQAVLTLKMQELKHLYPTVLKELKSLGIAPRKVQQYSQTAIESKLQIETRLKDSFSAIARIEKPIQLDSIPYKTFHYEDNYYSVEGRSYLNKQWLNISNRDTLVQVLYRQRKNKWLWIFSPFVYRQRIQCKNPNASIHYSQIIQIKR